MELLSMSLPQFALVLLVYTLLESCPQVESESDDDLVRYLRTKMKNYKTWLIANKLDPSPPSLTILRPVGDFDAVIYFECDISNHYMLGHSEVSDGTVPTSNFSMHSLALQRTTSGLYETHGQFTCTGRISSGNYPELSKDLFFSGRGKFLITANSTAESLEIDNVGITQDYKLDISHARSRYLCSTNQKFVQLKGEWNDSRIIGTYLNDVEQRFGLLYQHYESQYDYYTLSFPSAGLLDKYFREITKGLDLKKIMDTEDLPEPFDPTPENSNAGERVFLHTSERILLMALVLLISI